MRKSVIASVLAGSLLGDLVIAGCVPAELEKLLPSDPGEKGFGYRLAADNNTLAISAWKDDELLLNLGAVYIFAQADNVWAQQAKLAPPEGSINDLFGEDLAIDGDWVLVGAPQADVQGADSGSAYLFGRRDDQWSQAALPLPNDLAPGDRLGAVAIDGARLAIGSLRKVYIYELVGGDWSQAASVPGGAGYVALAGDHLLVGDWKDSENGPGAGAVYAYRWDGAQWLNRGKLLASDGAAQDEFGRTFDLDGDDVLISANRDDDKGPDSGSAYVFHWNGTDWLEESKLLPKDGAAGDRFGHNQLTIDGDRAVIPAWKEDESGFDAGAAYLFVRRRGAWTQEAKLLTSDGQPGDTLHAAVFNGDEAIVGVQPDGAGAAYCFDLAVAPRADVSGDGAVDSLDLNLVLTWFGQGAGGDIDGDGVTNSIDLNLVLAEFGDGC